MPVMLLLLQKGIEQTGVQVFRDRGAVRGGDLCRFLYGKDTVDDIERVKMLFRPSDAVGFLSRPCRAYLRIGVPDIGVLQFFRVGRFIDIQYKAAAGDPVS